LRSYLPDIAALAANAPFLSGADTGLASVRPSIGLLLPRQGVPPALESWDEFADALEWGARASTFDRSAWWWELRPHVTHGTLELRVPDAQTTVDDAAAVAALGQCLVAWLCERRDGGERLPVAPSWRIAENRWLAARDGAEARLVDLDSGDPYWLSERISALIEELAPTAARLGCPDELAHADVLARRNGAVRQREAAAERGIEGVTGWLRDEFLAGCRPKAR
jgi:carboxylate-amine ligase